MPGPPDLEQAASSGDAAGQFALAAKLLALPARRSTDLTVIADAGAATGVPVACASWTMELDSRLCAANAGAMAAPANVAPLKRKLRRLLVPLLPVRMGVPPHDLAWITPPNDVPTVPGLQFLRLRPGT